jgi:hypothetical protein
LFSYRDELPEKHCEAAPALRHTPSIRSVLVTLMFPRALIAGAALGVLSSIVPAGASAASLTLFSSGSVDTYLFPLDAPERAVLNFALPASLLGADISLATLGFTGRTFGPATADIQRRDSALGNVTLASIDLPFNFGSAYAAVNVTAAVESWTGDGVARRPNEGLQLVGTNSVYSEMVTELHPFEPYWPTLTIDYVDTTESIAAGRIADAGSIFELDWSVDDVASLLALYAAKGGSAVIDDETWYYTAAEFSNGGPWGGPRELGEAWVDERGFKHVYLGSGVTTAPVPVPPSAVLLGAALVVMLRRRAVG